MAKVQGDEKCHLSECLGRGEKLGILVTISNAYLSLNLSAVWQNRSGFSNQDAKTEVPVGCRHAWLNFIIVLKM